MARGRVLTKWKLYENDIKEISHRSIRHAVDLHADIMRIF